MKVLFATGNPAKVRHYGERLAGRGIKIVTLKDLGIELDVDESGNNPMENAVLKAEAYHRASGLPTIAMDDGLFLDNLPEESDSGKSGGCNQQQSGFNGIAKSSERNDSGSSFEC